MFIEVYTIPIQEWNKPTAELKVSENRRLIAVDGISVKYSTKSPNRAEIRLRDGKELTVVGSYDDIIQRIINLGETSHIMKRLED